MAVWGRQHFQIYFHEIKHLSLIEIWLKYVMILGGVIVSHHFLQVLLWAVGTKLMSTGPSHMMLPEHKDLTHWGPVTHICVSNLTIIGSDNGLAPGRHQAIIWTNAGILLIGPSETNFSEIIIEIHTFSFKKMHLKMSSGKWQPFCLGLNVLTAYNWHKQDFQWQTTFAYAFSWKKIFAFWFEFHWN